MYIIINCPIVRVDCRAMIFHRFKYGLQNSVSQVYFYTIFLQKTFFWITLLFLTFEHFLKISLYKTIPDVSYKLNQNLYKYIILCYITIKQILTLKNGLKVKFNFKKRLKQDFSNCIEIQDKILVIFWEKSDMFLIKKTVLNLKLVK